MKKVAKKQEAQQRITIPPINFKTARVTLVGVTPLLVHQFSEKSKREIEEKHALKAKNKKGARDPMAEYQSSLYTYPGKKNTYGIPTGGIKNCAVTACKFIDGFPMTLARGSFHVLDNGSGLIPIKGSKPRMDSRMVNIGGFKKIKTPRYRGIFDKWAVTFDVKYNEGVISAEQLVNLYENAGFSVGLCEFRPEKNGNLGMFEVKRA